VGQGWPGWGAAAAITAAAEGPADRPGGGASPAGNTASPAGGAAQWGGLMLVSGLGIVLATILGFTIGVMRLSRNWLAARGYDPVYGARPLKREIQKELQDPLARLLQEGRILDGETIHVGVEGDALSINGVPNNFAKGRAALN
jgi:hypothetical protein